MLEIEVERFHSVLPEARGPLANTATPPSSDGTLVKLDPFLAVPEVCLMKHADQIPYYAPDGTSLGFRSLAAAKRLIAGGFVKPPYGRMGI